MASSMSAIKTLLAADGTLVAALTGGFYTWPETGSNGINKRTTPTVFDSYGQVKPCVVIKTRTLVPTAQVWDEAQQLTSQDENIELWFYDSAAASGATIEAAVDRVYALLQGKNINSKRAIWRGNILNQRDAGLNDALYGRSEYLFKNVLSP